MRKKNWIYYSLIFWGKQDRKDERLMRDINRIEPFMNEVAGIWKEKFPDWRFGQLMSNFFCAFGDPFYYINRNYLKSRLMVEL